MQHGDTEDGENSGWGRMGAGGGPHRDGTVGGRDPYQIGTEFRARTDQRRSGSTQPISHPLATHGPRLGPGGGQAAGRLGWGHEVMPPEC